MRALALAFVTFVIAASPVLADPAGPAHAPAPARAPVHVLDIEPEDVAGGTPTPDDVGVRIITFGSAASLVHVRRHFIPEIVKTAEDL